MCGAGILQTVSPAGHLIATHCCSFTHLKQMHRVQEPHENDSPGVRVFISITLWMKIGGCIVYLSTMNSIDYVKHSTADIISGEAVVRSKRDLCNPPHLTLVVEH